MTTTSFASETVTHVTYGPVLLSITVSEWGDTVSKTYARRNGLGGHRCWQLRCSHGCGVTRGDDPRACTGCG